MKFPPFPLYLLPLLWGVAAPFLFAAPEGEPEHRDICQIQGAGPVSPFHGDLVATSGVVTFDLDDTWEKGFYLQHANCDGNPATSDALFVYTGVQADLVSVGDFVEISGWVEEFGAMTEVSAGPEYIEVEGSAPLPAKVVFSPPWPLGAARAYAEAREGMRIVMNNTVVVGPTTVLGQTFVVDYALGVDRILTGMPTGPIIRVDDDGLFAIEPEVRTGQRVLGLSGILAVDDGVFRLRLTSKPAVLPYLQAGPAANVPGDLTFAVLNLHNLFDTFDQPGKQDPVLSPGDYQVKLEKLARMISEVLGEPLFISVQEAENAAVLQALSNRPEIETQYGHVLVDGPDVRGSDVGLLYRLDRVKVLSVEARQGCTALIDGLGPDGNLDPLNPANEITCDLDGVPGLEGNRLFSRPPLIVRLEVCDADCSLGGTAGVYWVISVHLKSKTQDTAAVEYTLPRRLEQAAFLVGLVEWIEFFDPTARLILLGDINDVMGSGPVDVITDGGLYNLMNGVHPAARYTYIFDGVSQVLDHVFVNHTLSSDPLLMFVAQPQPFAADYPAGLEDASSTPLRASDHDPILISLLRFTQAIYVPVAGGFK